MVTPSTRASQPLLEAIFESLLKPNSANGVVQGLVAHIRRPQSEGAGLFSRQVIAFAGSE
jgi:hypothetical protein